MKKKLALFDIDKTIYDGYIIFPLAKYHNKLNLLTETALKGIGEITNKYTSGEVEYEEAQKRINEVYVRGLTGQSYNKVEKATLQLLDKNKSTFYSYVQPLFKKISRQYDIYLVTGEMQFVAHACRQVLNNVRGFFSSKCEIKKGVITGNVNQFLAYREEKRKVIKALINQYHQKESFAIGDSEGDIGILSSVENALCINPTPKLKRHAEENKWRITDEKKILETISNTLSIDFICL